MPGLMFPNLETASHSLVQRLNKVKKAVVRCTVMTKEDTRGGGYQGTKSPAVRSYPGWLGRC